MTEKNKSTPVFESQKERWLKYGANVALMSIIVVLLVVAVVWVAQTPAVSARMDTTQSRSYSLKSQTLGIIRDNPQKIELISLYTRTRAPNPDEIEPDATDYVQPVEDLLNEYKRKGRNIEVESIDPVSQPVKVEQLIERVTNRYGGEVARYRAVVEEYPAISKRLTELANAEVEKVRQFPQLEIRDRRLYETLRLTISTIQQLPKALEQTQQGIDRGQKQKPPDYKGATDAIHQGMIMLSQLVGVTVKNFTQFKDDQAVPEVVRTYMEGSLKNYEELKKIADELDQRITGLGELKLDDLKRSLRERDAILVLGPSDMRVIPRDKVWQAPQETRFSPTGVRPRPSFAGEQMITSAILAVTASSRPRVAFIRSGGPPLTMPGIPGFMQGGPYSLIAEYLREYNFEVVDKDLSGMWAMQAQMQGGFAPPEPAEEELHDAIWVVVDVPQQRRPMMAPPTSIGPKLAEHLQRGGSALVLARQEGDSLGEALEDYGIRIRTDAIAVHEPVKGGTRSNDLVEAAQRLPFIFLLRQYGDHLLTRPLNSLESVLMPLVIVQTEKREGVTVTPIIPVPDKLPAWGETDIRSAFEREEVKFDKDVDLPLPLFGGAVAEKKDGGRVVAIGSFRFPMDDMLMYPDERLLDEQGIFAPRFPGHKQLFLNSIFYLAKMEPMIAISPSALAVNRVADMSNAALSFWRIGVLLIGLPGLVVLGGVMMYIRRRD
jgi:hypothetical protein